MNNIGAQLYTVRTLLGTDIDAEHTLRQIKEIGYNSVQLFGSGDVLYRSAKYSKKAGLGIIGYLSDITHCKNHEREVLDFCNEYGIADIGISASAEECQNPYEYIKEFNEFAKRIVAAGFSVSYHNHGYEFIKLSDEKSAMQHFISKFDKQSVNFMPDTYWIQDGGYDVRYFIEQVKNRIKIIHLKDIKRTTDGHTFTEVGSGNLYFDGIIKSALDCGAEHFVVEQDV